MDFDKLTSFETNGIQVTKYKSKQTGLTVILADVEGPLVEGAFVLSTEAHDDDGCPHTLEHLIFLGSELYPYKGILDGLANRCLAQGTNAWTDTDHTAYTLTTAGEEGFLNLLPVYLDHVLYPTLTDTGFHTEVHHITGEGKDAGVVYCEMQGRENSQISLVYRSLLQNIYPGDCGYSYETGGIMKNLRSLHVNKVRQYHRDFYRPDNLCLLISGKVNADKVFKVLEPVQQRILGKGTLPKMTRPWSDPVPPLTKSITSDTLFPSDDEETGMVIIGWRGPTYSDFNTISALKTLWKYLTDTAVSHLYKLFVEIEDPYCTDIYYGTIDNSVTCQYVRFENVPASKIADIKDKLFATFNDIISTKNIDMNRIKDIIEKCILEHNTKLEESPHRYVQFTSIGHFLYANQDTQLNDAFQEINRLNLLKDQSVDFWLNLIKQYLLDQYYICVNGIPSIKYSQELRENEDNRIKEQVEQLGESKLKELASELENATKKNETPIPQEIMTQFKVPDVSNIPFFPICTVRNNIAVTTGPNTDLLVKKLENENCTQNVPFFIQFDNLPSNFVELRVLLDTSHIPKNLKNYLELYLDTFFELPILRNKVVVPYEEVVTELNRDVISYSCSTGIKGSKFDTGSFGQLISIDLKLQSSKYTNGIQWLKDLLWHSQFSAEKLKINVTKLINDIPQRKRKGHTVNKAILQTVNFDNVNSNQCITSILNQAPFLNDISVKLESKEGTDIVINDLNNLRNQLLASLRVQVIANLLQFNQDIKSPWLQFLPEHSNINNKEVPNSKEFRNKDNKTSTGYIVGIGAIDNSFLIASSNGIQSYQDPLEAALWVIDEYLTGMESPFWKKIRGLGYSYGYGNSIKIEEGLIYFTLSRSTNVVKAYEVAQSIIKDLKSRQVPLDLVHLESAKSGAIFSIVSREENIESAGLQSILNYLKNLPSDSNKSLLRKIQQVTPNDIYSVLETHISPLFQSETSNIVIATNPSQITAIKDGFKLLHRSLQEKSI